jgi:mRNA interferase MazF
MRRGDLVMIVLQAAYGKPRPALIIQSDLFGEHPSVTIIPITSELRDTPLFRVPVRYGESTGLRKPSEVMSIKVMTTKRAFLPFMKSVSLYSLESKASRRV